MNISNKRHLTSKIQLYVEKLNEVVKYIGSTITKYGSNDSEIKIRLSQAISAMVQDKIKYLSISSIFYSNLWLRILDYKFNKQTTMFRKQVSQKTS